jgi:hypothetical protein
MGEVVDGLEKREGPCIALSIVNGLLACGLGAGGLALLVKIEENDSFLVSTGIDGIVSAGLNTG